ncbi:rhomboid-domain-containing protein [Russula earlei]|uniref:Rhomboid-domain-containing protein n=1 Tax=Russula earlei TaxID=71964 RepID=A0ACC0UH61_9AGAM|nr:rhomboid-domain-containing protein [Russula earlei]
MLIATARHTVLRLRSANPIPASRISALSSPRISQRYALHNTARLCSRVSPVHKFHATELLGATHRSTARHAHRDRKLSQRFNDIPKNYILYGILGINGVIFAAWTYVQMFQGTTYISRPPSARWLARWLQDNFINSYENLRQGRFWTLVTSTFSHAEPGHALLNGLTFWFLAPTALAVLGNAHFLALYLGSGVFASLASLAWNKHRNYHSHGASGAIYALASFFAFAVPNARFLLFFVLPMPAWACIGAIGCFDVYNAFTRRFPSLDSAGHVGGLTAGALYWMMRTRFRLL